jgi:site-specific DNA-adenine methylase
VRYGIPYKGSKNSIAEWIVSELPRADIFVDLFFGGEQ